MAFAYEWWTSSIELAAAYDESEEDIISHIDELECSVEFARLNFEACEYIDDKGVTRPVYNMTYNGYALLALALGFAGEKAETATARLNEYRRSYEIFREAIADR